MGAKYLPALLLTVTCLVLPVNRSFSLMFILVLSFSSLSFLPSTSNFHVSLKAKESLTSFFLNLGKPARRCLTFTLRKKYLNALSKSSIAFLAILEDTSLYQVYLMRIIFNVILIDCCFRKLALRVAEVR